MSFRAAEPATAPGGQTVSTNEQGKFTAKLAEGDYQVSVSAQGYRPYYSQRVTVATKAEPLQIPLEPQPMIKGRILKPDKTPLANAQVRVSLRVRHQGGGWSSDTVLMTDAEGHYKAPFERPGKVDMRITTAGVGYALPKTVEVQDKDAEDVDFELVPGASVSGQVKVKGTGEPVRGASVSVNAPGGGWLGSAQTDQQGRFALRDLPPGRCDLRAYAQNYMQQQRGVAVTLEDRQTLDVGAVELAPAVQVTGRILRPDGAPVANAVVTPRVIIQVAPNSFNTQELRNVTTDAQGSFNLQVTQSGDAEMSLRLAEVGFVSARFKAKEGENVENLEVKLQPFLTAVGVVRDEKTKKPLQGATVRANYSGPWRGDPPQQPQSTSDAQGRFELTGLTPGDYYLNAQLAGYVQRSSLMVRLGAAKAPEITLDLGRGYSVRGQVLDKAGRGVAGAKVRVGGSGTPERTTDAQGRFAFDGLQYVGAVQASAPGWAPVTKSVRAEAERPAEITLVLRYRPGSVSGQLLRSDTKQPVRDGLVLARSLFPATGLDGDPWILQGFEEPSVWQQRRGMDQWPWANLKGLPYATTDEQGRFVLADLAESEYTLSAVGPAIRQTRRFGVIVQAGKATENVILQTRPKGEQSESQLTFSGRLVRPDGAPAARAEIQWGFRLRWSTSTYSGFGTSQTKDDGTFELDHPPPGTQTWSSSGPVDFPATVDLSLGVEGFKPILLKDVKVEKDRKVANLEAKLQEGKPGVVSGRLLLPDGKTPAVGVRVVPFTKNRPFPPGRWGVETAWVHSDGKSTYFMNRDLASRTDEQGRFRIEGLWADEYGLFATTSQEEYGPRPLLSPDDPLSKVAPTFSDTFAVKEGEETKLDLTLSATGSVSGAVVDEAGKPIAGAQISTSRRFGHTSFDSYRSARSAEQGEFLVEGLRPGAYGVSAYLSDYGSSSQRTVEVKAGEETKGIVLKLRREQSCRISGRVFLPDGRMPAENAQVFLVALPGGTLWSGISALSDEKGGFVLERMSRGHYKAVATKVGYGRGESAELKVKPSAEAQNVTIVLTEAATLRGQVVAEDGKTSVSDVVVGAALERDNVPDFSPDRGNRGLARLASTDAEGRFELRDLPPGPSKVFVFASRGDQPRLQFASYGGGTEGLIRAVQREVQAKPRSVIEGLTLRLRPANCAITGIVKRADGTPLARANVSLYGEWVGGRRSAQTGEEGRFTITKLAPGVYSVYAEAADLSGLTEKNVAVDEQKPEATVSFTLSVGGTITGRIADKTGKPVENAFVNTTSNWQQPEHPLTLRSDATKEDGAFTLKNLAPGQYELTVSHQDFATKKVKVLVKEGETSTVNVVMEEE